MKKYKFNLRTEIGKKNNRGKLDEYFPLKAFLKCSKCGNNIYGSRSTSQTGAKHYYYHCNKKGCGERFKIASAHDALTDYFKGLQANGEVSDLFELIMLEKI